MISYRSSAETIDDGKCRSASHGLVLIDGWVIAS